MTLTLWLYVLVLGLIVLLELLGAVYRAVIAGTEEDLAVDFDLLEEQAPETGEGEVSSEQLLEMAQVGDAALAVG